MIFLRHKQVGIQVKIGRENSATAMEDCSLISATYSIGEEQLGTIAILGPTRMQYSRVISLLQLFTRQITDGLKKIKNKEEYIRSSDKQYITVCNI